MNPWGVTPDAAWEGLRDGPVLDMCCSTAYFDGRNRICSLPLDHDGPHICADLGLPNTLVWAP